MRSNSGSKRNKLAVKSISAVTLATADMTAACAFYDKLGFKFKYGGPESTFSSYQAGAGQSLNLICPEPGQSFTPGWWGRVIFFVADVDACYRQLLAAGLEPDAEPVDAPWQERFFHIIDPDGHELSFAQPLDGKPGLSPTNV